MTNVSFTPTFHHTDYVDNRDRVQAGGPNGFNARFQAIASDFASLQDVVGVINASLIALSQAPAPTPVKLTLTPTLVTIADPWSHVVGGAAKPAGATDASGLMSVSLPNRATIRELRVCGRKDSGTLTVGLRRQSLAAGSTTELIVGLTASNGNFDISAAAPVGAAATVDNDQFRYYLTAELEGAAAGSVVQLTCFQIIHVGT